MLICPDEVLQMAIELLHEESILLAKPYSAAETGRLPRDIRRVEGLGPFQAGIAGLPKHILVCRNRACQGVCAIGLESRNRAGGIRKDQNSILG